MAKVIVRKIGTVDASKGFTVKVNWSGARSYALRILITSASTNATVYDYKQSGYSLSVTVPANAINNGASYYIQAQTFDSSGTASALSDKVGFYALATPTFSFEAIPSPITSSSYTATINYYSSDLEPISSYTFYLYESTKKQVLKSSTSYDQTDISYTYRGLLSDTSYYFRCIGVTVNGLELDTGYVKVSVDFSDPSEYARVYATNLPDRGGVLLDTNIKIVSATRDDYEYEDGKIVLRNRDLVYNHGFNIEDDFTVMLRGTELWKNATLMTMKNQSKSQKIVLSSHIYGNGTLRFNLKVFNGLNTYLIYSEPLSFTDLDNILIAVRRIDNIYQIKTFTSSGDTLNGNWWWGNASTPKKEEDDQWVDTEGSLEHFNHDDVTIYLDNIEPANAIVGDLWFSDSDFPADVTEDDISTVDTLEKYLAKYTVTAEFLAKLNLTQMGLYLKWFDSLITAVKARLNSAVLEAFYDWSIDQLELINEWYSNHGSPASLTSIIDTITNNIDTIM